MNIKNERPNVHSKEHQPEDGFSSFKQLKFVSAIFVMLCSMVYLNTAFIFQVQNKYVMLGVGLLLIGSFIYLYMFVSNAFSGSTQKRAINGADIILIIGCSFFLAPMTVSSLLYIKRDQAKFKESNISEASSIEFAQMLALAKANNVMLRFGNFNNSWTLTRLNVPNGSGASLFLKNGYCEMNYNSESIRDLENAMTHGLGKSSDTYGVNVGKNAVMAHELSHCIDIKRDFIFYNLSKFDKANPQNTVVGTHAVAPIYRHLVQSNDIQTYLDAAKGSTLWKEAFSDLYSMGYMHLNYPAVATQMTNNLAEFREKYKDQDSYHETSCWLKLIDKVSKPKSIDDLTNWADTIRNHPECTYLIGEDAYRVAKDRSDESYVE